MLHASGDGLGAASVSRVLAAEPEFPVLSTVPVSSRTHRPAKRRSLTIPAFGGCDLRLDDTVTVKPVCDEQLGEAAGRAPRAGRQ
jgi:hypothetical protein